MSTCPTCGKRYSPGTRLCPDDGGVLEGAPPEEGRVGSVVAGKYRLDGFLSRGGMGTVYRATHVMLGKPCAVKLIRPDLVTSPELVRRFLREARAAAALAHPHIVVVFDLGEGLDGTLYIAMELVQGRSLNEVLRAEGPMAPARIVRLLRQVAGALALAHREHIVHRDLKPQNLMIARDSEGGEAIKLLDFGIAKTFGEHTELTATGLVLGTPQYMSPEQVSGGEVDHRTDLYALGVILYQMLAGEVPFHAPSTPALLMKHVNEPPEPPSRRRPDLRIPPALDAVALRCLEKDPARRFQSAEEFAAALERALWGAAEEGAMPLRRAEGVERVDGAAAALRTDADRAGDPTVPLARSGGSEPMVSAGARATAPPAEAMQPAAAAPAAGVRDTSHEARARETSRTEGSRGAEPAAGSAARPSSRARAVAPDAAASSARDAGPPARATTRLPHAAAGAAAMAIVVVGAWAVGLFGPRSGDSGHSSGTPAADAANPAGGVGGQTAAGAAGSAGSAPSGAPDVPAGARTGESGERGGAAGGAAGATPATQADASTEAAARARVAPPPALPPVWVQCAGAQEVCGPYLLAFELTFEDERLPAAPSADRAEVALAIRAAPAPDRQEDPAGLLWARAYAVSLEARAPRVGAAVPMPPARTLTFDAHFGRDAVMEVARTAARDAAARIREFWRARVR